MKIKNVGKLNTRNITENIVGDYKLLNNKSYIIKR